MKQEDIVTFYGTVRIASVVPGNPEAKGVAHYQINTSYINNMRQIVRAKMRSNLEFQCPAVVARMPYSNEESFIVRKELVVGQLGIDKMHRYFSTMPEVAGELEAFRRAFLQVWDNVYKFGQTRELRCVVEHPFSEAELNSKGGLFYHKELDTLFKFGEGLFEVAHPYSAPGQQAAMIEAATQVRDEHGFVFWVEIIDNDGKYGDRYLSICNNIYKIEPKTDKNRPDGLYIVSSKPSHGRITSTEVQSRTYSLDNIEKELGIYATYELAQSHGDIASTRKREQLEREHEYAREKQNWAQERLELERENSKRDQRIKEMELERATIVTQMKDFKDRQEHLQEIQRLQMKEKYDERQAERKDASELIKFLPTILTAIGTILMVWKTFKTS